MAIASLFIFSSAMAAEVQCRPQSVDLQSSATDLWASACVPTCTKVFKVDSDKAKSYFEKNCRAFAVQSNRPFSFSDLRRNIGGILNRALLQCLPKAGKKAVVGTYEFVKALPAMISYLLSAPAENNSAAGLPRSADQMAACEKLPDCRRALARNTLRYQEMNPDKSWKISDAQLDQQISHLSFNELLVQAEHDHQLAQNECLGYLGELRRKISSDGEDWTPARHQKVFDSLADEHPHCPGVLKLLPPDLNPPADIDNSQSACLKTSPQPISCFSLREKIALGTVCMGQDFTDDFEKMQVEFCSDVVQVVVPVPLIGPQTRFLPKLARSEKAVTEAQHVVVAATTSDLKKVSIPRGENIQNFLTKYKESVFVSEEQNRRYISLAENSSQTIAENKTRFFDVENSVMKKLNDSTNDKDLVTSLTNFQKETFLKNLDTLKAKYPNLKFELYSDFKSVKIAIQGQDQLSPALNSQLLADLNQLYLKSNAEFAAEVKNLKISVPDAGEPEKWFKAGYGRSVDEAAIAARKARQSPNPGVLDYASSEVQGQMTQKLAAVEQSRQALSGSEKMQPLLETSSQGIITPKQDVFDLVRKNNSPESLAGALSSRYHLTSFSVEDAKQLQDYVKGVDEFSPTILIAKRENVNLDKALSGGASADFLGMGSANLKATAEGIAAQSTLEKALAGARTGEQEVTKSFKSRMEQFKKTVGGKVLCSGDDCVRVADAALSDKEKTRIMKALADNPDTRQVRMSFVGPGVPQEARMQLASHGESIEKNFRKELEGHVDFDKLQKMTFGFDMQTTQLNQGQVNLIIGKSGVRLNAQEQAEMQKAFAKALQKYNQDIRTYTQGTSRTSDSVLQLVPGPGVLGLMPDDH